jgi:hypothetical protein
MPELGFQDAVERVARHGGAAFAFRPIADEKDARAPAPSAGGNLFVIARCPTREPHRGQPQICIYYVGGRYGTTSLARETYALEAAPREAREASYLPLKEFDESMLRNDLQSIHRELLRRAER